MLSRKIGIDRKLAAATIVLVASTFIWYFLAFNLFKDMLGQIGASYFEILEVLGLNVGSVAFSALLGPFAIDKINNRVRFLCTWLFVGIVFSLLPLTFTAGTIVDIAVVSIIFGVYFGIGMPVAMDFYASSTCIENRGRLAGITFMVTGVGWFLFESVAVGNTFFSSLTLAIVRLFGLLIFVLLRINKDQLQEKGKITYAAIITNRPFVLYFVPWLMFSLVNFMTFPFSSKIFGQNQELVSFSVLVENVIIAVIAIGSGFLADAFGRRRLAILGFAMLGLGYAVLGLVPNPVISIAFYTLADGVAWGIFYVMFLFTLWGDIGQDRRSERIYAIGALPYLVSNFMRFWLQPYLSSIPETAIFSFASVFLFLGVLPLFYAPETLPETTIKGRELQGYLEKAKKIKEKYA